MYPLRIKSRQKLSSNSGVVYGKSASLFLAFFLNFICFIPHSLAQVSDTEGGTVQSIVTITEQPSVEPLGESALTIEVSPSENPTSEVPVLFDVPSGVMDEVVPDEEVGSVAEESMTEEAPVALAAAAAVDGEGGVGEVANAVDLQSLTVDQNTGSAVYRYEITLPKGRGLFTPEVDLLYQHQAATDQSVVGYGWSLTIPYLERSIKYGTDKQFEEAHEHFSSSDHGELVVDPQGLYRSKSERGSFVTYERSGGGWIGADARGVRYFYGTTESARQGDSSQSGRVGRWYLERVEDPNGNYSTYHYQTYSGVVYPDYITYTNHDEVEGVYEVRFSFTPAAPYTFAYAGVLLKRDRILSQISVYALGSELRRYVLRRDGAAQATRQKLIGVTEIGVTASSTITLPETVFRYGGERTTTWKNDDTVDFPEPFHMIDNGVRFGDLNGDGWTDIVRYYRRADYENRNDQHDYTVRRVHLNNGDGTWEVDVPWDWADLRVPFMYQTKGVVDESTVYLDFGTRLVDVNGDGRDDLVAAYSAPQSNYEYSYLPYGQVGVYLNTGTGFVRDDSFSGLLPLTSWNADEYTVHTHGREFIDVNGDGLPDLVTSNFISDTNGSPAANTSSQVRINTGTGWIDSSLMFPAPLGGKADKHGFRGSRDMGTRWTDVNGDGLIDVMRGYRDNANQSKPSPNYDERTVYLNTGVGWVKNVWHLPIEFIIPDYPAPNRGFHMVDINGDRQVDIVRSTVSSTGNEQFDCYYNNGRGWEHTPTNCWFPFFLNAGYRGHNDGKSFMDADGDTIIDVLALNYFDTSSSTQMSGGSVWVNQNTQADVLTEVQLPKGGRITLAYDGFLSTTRNRTEDIGTPGANPLVVTSITYSDPLSTSWERTFSYADGVYEYDSETLRDRRFAGFGIVTETTDTSKVKTYFHQGNDNTSDRDEVGDGVPKIGLPYRYEVCDPSGSLFEVKHLSYTNHDSTGGGVLVLPEVSISKQYDDDGAGRASAERLQYNTETGALIQRTRYGEVDWHDANNFADIGLDAVNQEYAYATDPQGRIKHAVSEEVVQDHSGNVVSEVRYMYDNEESGAVRKGNVTEQREWVTKNPDRYRSKRYEYNGLGNILRSFDARGGTTTYAYDSYGLLPVEVTNPAGQKSTYEYDYGTQKPTVTKDPNGNILTAQYDPLGRLLLEQGSDSATGSLVPLRAYTYSDEAGSVYRMETKYVTDVIVRPTYTYENGFGQPIQQRRGTESPAQFIVRDWHYDGEGRVTKESLPYLASGNKRTAPTAIATLYTTYGYDALGRVREMVNVTGRTGYLYNDWQRTVTDPLGKTKRYEYDGLGRLDAVVEYLAGVPLRTQYSWSPQGQLVGVVDAMGNVRNFSYDMLGRRTRAEDLHAPADTTYGVWVYQYDDTDNLIMRKAPDGMETRYQYDVLGRVATEAVGSSSAGVRYTYDTCVRGIGKVCSVVVSGTATTTYAYTPNGLLDARTVVMGTSTYGAQYDYSRHGAPTLTTYPDGSQSLLVYNAMGRVDALRYRDRQGPWQVVVVNANYGPHEKITHLFFNNKATTIAVYDQNELYRLRKSSTTLKATSTSQTLLNSRYLYDKVGNITRVIDESIAPLTGTVSYTYDDLYRLRRAQTSGTTTAPYTHTFTYNAIGNLTNRSDVGGYLYGGHIGNNYANPHAVTAIAGITQRYDANGNVLAMGSTTYSWDHNQRLVAQASGARKTRFGYGHDGARLFKQTGGVTTGYPVPQYEVTGATSTKYLYIGDQLVASIDSSKGTSTVRYHHVDHLGSIVLSTNQQGGVEDARSYYPFGNERASSTRSGYQSARQYIGQEYDEETSLSYLNARYYKNDRGQFISQDPAFLDIGGPGFEQNYERTLQQHLLNPQALNSYSYAHNNPIRYSDPEGEIVPFLLGAWALAELGLSAYDGYNAYETVNDPNASELDKSIAVGGFAAGIYGPGGGYGTAGKQAMRLYKQTNSAGQVLMKGVNNKDVLSVINDNYRAGSTVGNGSTADAVRHEILTGESVGGKFHSVKAQQQINRINNLLKNSGSELNSQEKKALNTISNDLKNALKTRK